MKKKLMLLGVLLMSYHFIMAQKQEQQCTGNACSVVKIAQDSVQNQTMKNSGTRQVKVGVKWYFDQCRDIIYYTLAPGETKTFNIQYFCPPYTAEYDGTPPPKKANGNLH